MIGPALNRNKNVRTGKYVVKHGQRSVSTEKRNVVAIRMK